MKILTVCNHYPPLYGGGMGLQTSWFCEGLSARGHRVLVVSPRSPKGSPPESPTLNGVTISRDLTFARDDLGPFHLALVNLRNVAAVRRSARMFRPDVIFCTGMDGVGFNTYLAAIEMGIPSLTWLGDTWLAQAWNDLRRYDALARLADGGDRPGIARSIKRLFGWCCRYLGLFTGTSPRTSGPVACLSQFVLDDLRRSGAPVAASTSLVQVMLHPEYFRPGGLPIGHSGIRGPSLRALFVGRMELLKGPDTAILGLASAVQAGADVRLTLAGLGVDGIRKRLTDLATEHCVVDRITFAGTPILQDLIELYRNHDVFLFPSRIVEGMGVVNAEALACGLPIIGTAHSGSAEVIVHEKSGFHIEKEDYKSLGMYLRLFDSDRALLHRMSNETRGFATRFAPGRVLDLLESELCRVAGQSSRGKELFR